MGEETTRWTITVDRNTDVDLRSYLAERGADGDLSKFVENAVRWRLFNLTIAEAREGFKDLPAEQFESLIDEALADVRKR
jgi:hypothetical protein